MTPTETATILRQFNEWLKGSTQWAPTRGAEAVEAAVEMIERMDGALDSLLIRCDDSDSQCTAPYQPASCAIPCESLGENKNDRHERTA